MGAKKDTTTFIVFLNQSKNLGTFNSRNDAITFMAMLKTDTSIYQQSNLIFMKDPMECLQEAN